MIEGKIEIFVVLSYRWFYPSGGGGGDEKVAYSKRITMFFL
jgi:hypothetical protein